MRRRLNKARHDWSQGLGPARPGQPNGRVLASESSSFLQLCLKLSLAGPALGPAMSAWVAARPPGAGGDRRRLPASVPVHNETYV